MFRGRLVAHGLYSAFLRLPRPVWRRSQLRVPGAVAPKVPAPPLPRRAESLQYYSYKSWQGDSAAELLLKTNLALADVQAEAQNTGAQASLPCIFVAP